LIGRVQRNPAKFIDNKGKPFGDCNSCLAAQIIYITAFKRVIAPWNCLIHIHRLHFGKSSRVFEEKKIGGGAGKIIEGVVAFKKLSASSARKRAIAHVLAC